MPRQENPVSFDPDAENKNFRPLHQNQIDAAPSHSNEIIFDSPHKRSISSCTGIKSSSIPHTEIKFISTTHKVQVDFPY